MSSYSLGVSAQQVDEFIARELATRYAGLSSLNVLARKCEVYGFRIRQSLGDTQARVEYMGDNMYWDAAAMNYSTGTFGYGNWAKAFFIKELVPVMLYSSGKEAYKLNPDNLAQKAAGGSSDIANTSFDGNAMMRIPRVYIKAYEDGNYIYVWVSNQKIDTDFQCWAHHDDLGNEIPYLYLSIYNGVLSGTKMRSLSGIRPNNTTADTTQITYCDNNNPSGKHIWSCYTLSSWMLILFLMVLISKSTNTQKSFGNGHYTGGSSAGSLLNTGTANTRGLFWGTNGTGSAVKVFGLENWYANIWKRVIGYGVVNRQIRYKLTYGTEDGSTAVGYSNAMTGYKSTGYTMPSFSQTYLATFRCIDMMLFPSAGGGSDSTFYSDGAWSADGNRICYLGGSCRNGLVCGGFAVGLDDASGASAWNSGAGVECRPRLGEEQLAAA